MEHHVAGQRVAVCLGAALRVEHLRDVAQVVEDVESVEGKSAAIAGGSLFSVSQNCFPCKASAQEKNGLCQTETWSENYRTQSRNYRKLRRNYFSL